MVQLVHLYENSNEVQSTTIIDEKTFLRKKKVYLSSIISGSDDIFSVNNKITNDIINNGFFDTNYYNKIKDLNYVELNEILNKINYNKTYIPRFGRVFAYIG